MQAFLMGVGSSKQVVHGLQKGDQIGDQDKNLVILLIYNNILKPVSGGVVRESLTRLKVSRHPNLCFINLYDNTLQSKI